MTLYDKRAGDPTTAKQLNELADFCNELTPDEWAHMGNAMANLPTFGGGEPRCTDDVWSWDDKRLLVTDHSSNGVKIVPRCQCGEASWNCRCRRAE